MRGAVKVGVDMMVAAHSQRLEESTAQVSTAVQGVGTVEARDPKAEGALAVGCFGDTAAALTGGDLSLRSVVADVGEDLEQDGMAQDGAPVLEASQTFRAHL